jgi:hypothetical protein
MSSHKGFSILRNWKTFRSALWHLKSPRAIAGDWPVFVDDVSERKHALVLEFSGARDSFDLTGAMFRELTSEEVPPAERSRFVFFLELSFPDGSRWLLAESKPGLSGDPVN